ncbi:DNA cytosine methyltransferase [Sphingobium sp. JS3065]|uniref:DNA cytosine methyltransferase n=1 Tax=Sphingobium sp. JS3065 TaxID=2970925 RepID=UPI00226450CB|nr:DNA cytosine methyltransferase [Sphingobium sp. JS3065]UZW54020.1 DNA cytosine methyltransferase [Sphingobium sp. JS3065]
MGIIVDNFAGGGGASTGIEAALSRAVDIAINHDEQAIRMHEANHPGTRHIRNNIWQIDPKEVTGGQHVDLAWFSPDCKHFSKAKGGKPREKSIRDLAWVVVLWAQRVRPDVILLENVEEFRTWGPLCDEGKPIKERAGETFAKWTRELRKAGYKIQWKELRACDYGAPTIRKRFFMIARRDGNPIVWPAPTHGKSGSPEVLSGKLLPWRTAAEIIDWSIPCPSIFERKKPLAEKTLRRIAHGIMKFVVNNPSPFIVPICNTNWAGDRFYPGDEPLRTITTAKGGEMAVVAPHITKFRAGAIGHAADEPLHTVTANSYIKRPGGSAPLGVVETVLSPVIVGCGGRRGQSGPVGPEQPFPTTTTKADACIVSAFMQKFAENGKGVDPTEPLHTVMAGAPRHAVVCAHLEQANGGPNNENLAGRAADAPLSTVQTAGSQQRLVTSNLVKLRGTCRDGQPTDEPLHTVSAGGTHMAEVRAFLIKYYGNEQDGHGLDNPLGTVTVKERFGLVTVMVDGEEYVIVDIGMRMLSPRELFNAQGFPADYQIETDAHGQPITKTAQVAKCGNSVCPPIAEALVRAQFPAEAAQGERAAA